MVRYDPCYDIGILNEFQRFIVSRLERIYYRLTGIDIKELILNSHQPLTTKIIPSSIPIAIQPSANVEVHAVYSNLTAKIKPYKVVIE
ncbi:unnamed protein product [marine sediment metagenome]|uniref:Uncharacterized protein n=1 Tax=marine sediment metagenome TaxID=412755 RepID=X1R791_9ZZZZ